MASGLSVDLPSASATQVDELTETPSLVDLGDSLSILFGQLLDRDRCALSATCQGVLTERRRLRPKCGQYRLARVLAAEAAGWTAVELFDPSMADETARAIFDGKLSMLEQLSFEMAPLVTSVAELLFDGLRTNPLASCVRLDLYGSHLLEDGCRNLAAALAAGALPALQYLGLEQNFVGNAGVMRLAQVTTQAAQACDAEDGPSARPGAGGGCHGSTRAGSSAVRPRACPTSSSSER